MSSRLIRSPQPAARSPQAAGRSRSLAAALLIALAILLAPAPVVATVSLIPGEDLLGRRYNLEVGPGESNLQSFLAVQREAVEEGQSTGASRSQANPFPLPDREEITARIREFGGAQR